MEFIGLDAHSTTFTLAVLDGDTNQITCGRAEPTSEEHLIAAVSRVAGPKCLTVEESHLAQWVYMTLEPYVDESIVCDPKENRWIAGDDFANDRTSAMKLAELLRQDDLKPVYHPHDGVMAELRAVFLHYYRLNRHLVRCKNQLKATFRQVAIVAQGDGIYAPEHRADWLHRLEERSYLKAQAKDLFEVLEVLSAMKDRTDRRVLSRSTKLPG